MKIEVFLFLVFFCDNNKRDDKCKKFNTDKNSETFSCDCHHIMRLCSFHLESGGYLSDVYKMLIKYL